MQQMFYIKHRLVGLVGRAFAEGYRFDLDQSKSYTENVSPIASQVSVHRLRYKARPVHIVPV